MLGQYPGAFGSIKSNGTLIWFQNLKINRDKDLPLKTFGALDRFEGHCYALVLLDGLFLTVFLPYSLLLLHQSTPRNTYLAFLLVAFKAHPTPPVSTGRQVMDTQRKIVYGLRRRALLDPDEDIRCASLTLCPVFFKVGYQCTS